MGGGAGLPKPGWGWMIDGGGAPLQLIIGGGAGLLKPGWGWMIDGGGAPLQLSIIRRFRWFGVR
ncbi:MAG: hypothetical protein EA414_19070 [Arthrospira sp. PLM2.Bin9]|nr:MAG: hypothetical protein EA414_19070 [Arthrospira sp. PLM2.Bin9]